MELTGAGPVIILVLLALGLFAWVVIDRPRPRRNGLRLASRAVKVLFLNMVVLTLFGILLNNQYLFYSSWSDLFGWRATHVAHHVGGTPRDVIAGAVHGPGLRGDVAPRTLPALPNPGRRTQDYVVGDPYAGTAAPVIVHLPVGYDPSSPERYPVIVGLHGFPGSPASFARLTFLSTVDALTASIAWRHRSSSCRGSTRRPASTRSVSTADPASPRRTPGSHGTSRRGWYGTFACSSPEPPG